MTHSPALNRPTTCIEQIRPRLHVTFSSPFLSAALLSFWHFIMSCMNIIHSTNYKTVRETVQKKLCVNQALFVLEQKIFNVKSSLSCCHLVDATSQRSRIRPRLLWVGPEGRWLVTLGWEHTCWIRNRLRLLSVCGTYSAAQVISPSVATSRP